MNVVTPKFVNRKSSNSTNILDLMPTERLIEYVQSVYPTAKLIPNSKTYNRAVSEYNIVVRMGMDRPPIPKWFCGSVSDSTGELGPTVLTTPVSDRINGDTELTSSFEPLNTSAYEWDECLIYRVSGVEVSGRGYSPGTPDYVLCFMDDDTSGNMLASTLDSTFWDDFIVEYDEEAKEEALGAAEEMLGGGEGEEEGEGEGESGGQGGITIRR